jgi:hypothetical protein
MGHALQMRARVGQIVKGISVQLQTAPRELIFDFGEFAVQLQSVPRGYASALQMHHKINPRNALLNED